MNRTVAILNLTSFNLENKKLHHSNLVWFFKLYRYKSFLDSA
jgi:hypothetical protein